MRLNKITKHICIQIVLTAVLIAQSKAPEKIFFEHIGIEQGLSQSSVSAIIQDKIGYLWFGTANGLNRYDGYSFRVYYNDPADSTSLSDNGIRSLYEDKKGNIWIGTIEGVLNRFERSNGIFYRTNLKEITNPANEREENYFDFPVPFSRNNPNTISCIAEDKSGNLWIGTWGNGLIKYNPRTNKIERFKAAPGNSNSLQDNRINSIVIDENDVIWIGTLYNGLYKLVVKDKKYEFVNYLIEKNQSGILQDKAVFSLLLDYSKNLWIGTYGGGLYMLSSRFQNLNPKQAKFIHYSSYVQVGRSLSSNRIATIYQDRNKFLWIGTFEGGISLLNPRTGYIRIFKNNQQDPNSLSRNDVLKIFEDRSGNIWIGTSLGNGLDKVKYSNEKFKIFDKDPIRNAGLNDNIVWAIKSKDSQILVGTNNGGLNIWNRKTGKVSYLKSNPSDSNSISENHIRAIVVDKYDNILMGTYSGGLNIYNTNSKLTKRIKNIPQDSASLSANQIQCMYIDRDGDYWIGTFGGGLNKLTKDNFLAKNWTFKHYKNNPADPFSVSHNRIYTIYEDSHGIFWIGTFGGGLNKFDKRKERFISYKNIPGDATSLSDDRVVSIYEDKNKNLWIGTYGGGFCLFDRQKESFTRFYDKNRFKNSVIYGMLEDNFNHLWMSSDNGLSKFDIESRQITYYDMNDGLQSREFSGGAYFKSETGEMFFGGINGINYFYPDSVIDNTYIPPVVVSSIKIFNEPLRQEKDSIIIDYAQNFFSFDFAALDYTNPMDNQYAFMLEGFDKEWRFVDARTRSANYTNLAPGNYVFSVIGSNNDGVWNYEGKNIFIKILPPYWQRWWFILTAFLIVGTIIYYLATAKYRNLLAIEKLKTKLSSDLHDVVGSGLTEISILSELTSYQVGQSEAPASQNLSSISEKARQLIDNMSDIVWMINPKKDSFHDLIVRLKDSYADLMNSSGISFRTVNLERLKSLKLPMDYKHNLFLVFKEGLNNAIKHSKCKRISLEVNYSQEILEITLKDDGCGIDEKKINSGNGMRNMKERAASIGGVLEIISSDTGTLITFTEKKKGVNKFFTLFRRNGKKLE